MAMTLRLDDDDAAALKVLAQAQDISLHEAALRAIRRGAEELGHRSRVDDAAMEMMGRWGDVLHRLGRA